MDNTKRTRWPGGLRRSCDIYAVRCRTVFHGSVALVSELQNAFQLAIQESLLHYRMFSSGHGVLVTNAFVWPVLKTMHLTYVLSSHNAVQTKVYVPDNLDTLAPPPISTLPGHQFVFDSDGPYDILVNTLKQGRILEKRFLPIIAKAKLLAIRKKELGLRRPKLNGPHIVRALRRLQTLNYRWYFVGHINEYGEILCVEDPEGVLPSTLTGKWFAYHDLFHQPLEVAGKLVVLPLRQGSPRITILGTNSTTTNMQPIAGPFSLPAITIVLRFYGSGSATKR